MHLKTRADSCLSNSERDGMNESDSSLHPRRNLGNRYRSNALKFIRLAESDPERSKEHMNWAEQNARQALLHDYTDTRNWICLVELKVRTNDTNGLHAVIKDLFSVLGRDPEQLIQLNDVDFLAHGKELVHAALLKDPLNPEDWWNDIVSSEAESLVLEFVERCKRLDFRDQRANIVFARRLEQLQANGFENEFLEIAHHLLAHRPQNHELWMQIGRSHERRNEYDQAWLCYDHVQQLRPHLLVRDEFLQRLTTEMDGKKQQPWSAPTVEDRHAFLEKMERLTSRLRTVDHDSTEAELDDEHTDSMDKQKLNELISSNNMEEAFFYARRLVAQGEEWANEYLREIQENLS